MSRRRDSMIFGGYISYGAGHHSAAWRHPVSDPKAVMDYRSYIENAKSLERAGFDFVFLSDAPAVFNDDQLGFGGRVAALEPLTLLTAIAMETQDIGLIGTASTTYYEPYNVARLFASLDHISEGRAGWNIVTTSKITAASNFGQNSHMEHGVRYERAREFVEAVLQLWDTWEDDAFPMDKISGLYYDPSKRHWAELDGHHISIGGQLNLPRPPQGYPVLVQAGSSEPGRELAADYGEVIFTAQKNLKDCLRFARDLDKRFDLRCRLVRRPIILPGLTVYAAETSEKATSKVTELQELIDPAFGLSMLGDMLGGYDVSDLKMSDQLPNFPMTNANRSRRQIIDSMRNDGMNVGQIISQLTTSRGHLTLIGNYDQVTDEIEKWFTSGAIDGFNLMQPLQPRELKVFMENILPRLESRGLFKSRRRSNSLRERLGLKRPNHNQR